MTYDEGSRKDGGVKMNLLLCLFPQSTPIRFCANAVLA